MDFIFRSLDYMPYMYLLTKTIPQMELKIEKTIIFFYYSQDGLNECVIGCFYIILEIIYDVKLPYLMA